MQERDATFAAVSAMTDEQLIFSALFKIMSRLPHDPNSHEFYAVKRELWERGGALGADDCTLGEGGE